MNKEKNINAAYKAHHNNIYILSHKDKGKTSKDNNQCDFEIHLFIRLNRVYTYKDNALFFTLILCADCI